MIVAPPWACQTATERTTPMRRVLQCISLLAVAVVATVNASGRELFVSPVGDDANPATKARPFRTLEAARDALRRSKPAGGATVWLMAGRHHRTTTFELTRADSGVAGAPIVYRGVPGGRAVLAGGHRLDASKFRLVEDRQTTARLSPVARGKVLAASVPQGLGEVLFPGKGRYGMLSFNGQLLALARWPNRGYHHVRTVLDKGPTTRWLKPGEAPAPYSEAHPTGGKFTTRETWNHKAWAREFARTGDMLVEGYLHNDWYFQRERVGRIEAEAIQLLRHTRYGIVGDHIPGVPRRVRLVNVLYELDEPGEWYYDRPTRTLLLWPIAPMTAMTDLTVLGGPTLVSLESTEYVTVRDLTIENGGELAVRVRGGRGNVIGGCTIRSFLGRGVRIDGGRDNGIRGCDLCGLETAMSVTGGDRKTLTGCGNYAINCDIHRCRRRGYGAIGCSGVGIRFAHNLVHDMNGAVLFNSSNDFVMEYNEFYNMGWEMGDWNVAYCGAQWWTYGNVLRYNFVHHLMEMPGAYPVIAFRGDDGDAGTSVIGNVFYKTGRAAVAFHGAGNRIVGNVILGVPIAWSSWIGAKTEDEVRKAWDKLKAYDRGELRRGDKGDYLWRTEKVVGKEGWKREPWRTRYPLLAEVMATGNPWAQTLCEFRGNYAHIVRTPIYVHRGSPKDLPNNCRWEPPLPLDPQKACVDPASLNFAFRPGFKPAAGFARIPFERIGLRVSEFRRHVPSKDAYRRAVRKRYEGVRSTGGRYNPDTINRRYPLPVYLAGGKL